MPVMPGYVYADCPHEKTVVAAGWKYGCHSDKAADAPRVGPGLLWMFEQGRGMSPADE